MIRFFLFLSLCLPLWAQEQLIRIDASYLEIEGKRVEHGPYREWAGGVLVASGNHHRGKAHGSWFRYHPEGQLASKLIFDQGRQIEKEERWAPNGTRTYHVIFTDKGKDGLEEAWHPSGQRKLAIHWKQGSREGPSQSWFENGQEERRATYRFNQLHGDLVEWNTKGEVIRKAFYQHGTHLVIKFHSEKYNNGNMKLAYSYYKDFEGEEVKHGLFNKWFPNGENWIQCEYVHGQLDGLWQYGKKDGLHCRQESWKMGVKDGLFLWLHQGKPVKEQVWREGELVKTVEY